MSIDNMLAALQGSFDLPVEHDIATVRGLLRYCHGWLKGEVTAEQLHNPCLSMSSRLKSAADLTFRDLDGNPDMVEEVREPVVVTGEGYEAIAGILEELPILAAENKRRRYRDLLDDFEAERMAVVEATEEINAQMSGKECRCPRCGQSGKDRCQTCGLTLLYPDPRQLQDQSYRLAQLSPIHDRIFTAFQSIRQGKASLESLSATLPPLSAHLRDLTRFADHAKEDELPSWLLPSLRSNIEVAKNGVERLAGAQATRRISDLNRGWEDIFEASQAIRADLAQAGRATGRLPAEPSGLQDGFSA